MSDASTPLVPDWPHDRPMTLQEMFDRAWDWAVVQKMPPCYRVDREGSRMCTYRSQGGTNACLIGACIPDSLYREGLDDGGGSEGLNAASSSVERFPELRQVLWCYNLDILDGLQYCHDSALFEEDEGDVSYYYSHVENNLRAFAGANGLTIPGGDKANG